MEITSTSAQETQNFGQKLAASLKGGNIVCLYGDLGSGKTTFVQGLAQGLGLKTLPTSPTFVLIREYPIANKSLTLYHLDLYRLNNEQEIINLGLQSLFTDKNAIIVIEWAEKAKELLPEKRTDVHFRYKGEHNRIIHILDSSSIAKAVETLRNGGIVIYPTDTAFGIGCRIDDKQSVDRLFAIRKRPRTQATPILVSSKAMANKYFSTPSLIVRRLMEQYWPGALTIVAPCKKELIYAPIRGGSETIGLRMPNHSAILAVIEEIDVPILGPSANFHGGPTPYNTEDLNPQLVRLVDYVMPGTCTLKQPSTVIDTTTSPPTILRQGAIQVDFTLL